MANFLLFMVLRAHGILYMQNEEVAIGIFWTQIQIPNAKTHLLLQEIQKGQLFFLRWKGPDKAFPW